MSTPDAATPAGPWGLLAEFPDAAALLRGCERVRDAGFSRWDAHSPVPIHGLEHAMGVPRSHLGWAVLVGALLGAGGGMLLQWWVAVVAYPLITSGKPLFSYPAFVPITFELAVIGGVLGGLAAMFHLNRLPRLHHPLFASTRFERCSDDAFFIAIEAADPRFDAEPTRELLQRAGATAVERVEDVP